MFILVANCGGLFQASPTPQSLVLPNFPNSPVECVWNITTENPNSRINVSIQNNPGPLCYRLHIEIRSGKKLCKEIVQINQCWQAIMLVLSCSAWEIYRLSPGWVRNDSEVTNACHDNYFMAFYWSSGFNVYLPKINSIYLKTVLVF